MEGLTCPTLNNYRRNDHCFEQNGGTSPNVYVFFKSDLAAVPVMTGNVYATPTFKAGKGLYKIECKEEEQEIKGESNGKGKGFKLNFSFAIEGITQEAAALSRALNLRDVCLIVENGLDSDGVKQSQIMYDPDHNNKVDSGGINSDTGKKPEDDSMLNVAMTLSPVPYSNIYVTAPTEGGWDSLLVDKSSI